MQRVKFFPNPFKWVVYRIDVWLWDYDDEVFDDIRPHDEDTQPVFILPPSTIEPK